MTTEELYSPIGAEFANTSSLRSQILQSLKTTEEYRYAFVEERIQSSLAAQTLAIREQRKLDPKKFAEKLGKKVSWVYRLEDPNQPPPTIPSLLEVARAFGVDLEVRFRPFSELLNDIGRLSPDSLKVASFENELPEMERSASNERLRLWIQKSDYAAIQKYSEAKERMAREAGIDWENVKKVVAQHANSILWGKMPTGWMDAYLSSSGATIHTETPGQGTTKPVHRDIGAQNSPLDLASSCTATLSGVEIESSPNRFGANTNVISIDSKRRYNVVRIHAKRTKENVSHFKRRAS
jgi:transcriptional regulator with XRE-family HTH domain